MVKLDNKVFAGIIAMGLMAKWIGYLPFYGPSLLALGIENSLYSDLFVAAHATTLIGGAYYYARYRETDLIKKINTLLPFSLALLTVILLYVHEQAELLSLSLLFILIGFISGWVVSRWMAWFSSVQTAGKRGSILGKALFMSLLLIILASLVQTRFVQGLTLAMLFSAAAILTGSFICRGLPLFQQQTEQFNLKDLKKFLPPLSLILLALSGYAIIAMAYKLVITWGLKNPVIPGLLVMPYLLIGLILSPASDRSGRHLLLIMAFLASGFGFLILTIAGGLFYLDIAIGLLINSGLLLVRLFFWLSLVDFQGYHYAPLPFAIGVSFEVTIFGLIYSAANATFIEPDSAQIVLGLAGVFLVLICFAFIAGLTGRTADSRVLDNHWRQFQEIDDMDANSTLITHQLAAFDRIQFEQSVVEALKLTKREAGIAYMVAIGYKNQDICHEYHISSNTLKYHMKNIYSKLAVSNRDQAIKKLYIVVKRK